MPTFQEIRERDENETVDYHNFDDWHNAGYNGQGINFLEIESNNEHGRMVVDTFKLVAPEANTYLGTMSHGVNGDKVTHCRINDGGTYIDIEEYIEKYNIHIIGASLSFGDKSSADGYPQPLIDYLSSLPVIWVGSAGNDGTIGVTGKFEHLGLMSGAIYLNNGEIRKESYSAVEDTMDFATLHSWAEGTSFSSPVLAGMIAIILCKYGIISQENIKKILIKICIDAGEEGHDPRFGHGVPILPSILKMDTIVENILKSDAPEKPIVEEEKNEPIIEEEKEVNTDMKMYLARYAHLDDIKVSVGDVCQADIAWHGKGISPATEIGIQGNTGLSTGTHLHIDVVKVPYDPNFRYKKYTQADIYAGNPPADKTELYYFLDETLFKDDYIITTHFNSQDYYEEFGRRHPAADIVSLGNKTIYWNRSTRGRVVHTGYDNAYGKNVVIAYLDVDFDSYEGQEPIFNEPEKEIIMDSDNDLSRTWLNSVGNWMYNMSNKSDVKSTWGQTSDFDGKIRYIEMHPNNLGVVTAKATTDEIGYAGINATFFGITKDGWYYPTSILKLKDTIIQGNANHLPYPQGTFCYYQDGTFGIEQLKSVNDLTKPVWYAIGGIEYVRDSMVTYNATAEGFVGIYSDVHRRTTHVSIGLTKEGKILLTRHWDSTRAECAIHMKEMGCIYAIGLDGGGSAKYITPDEKRTSTRKVANHLVAVDLKI
jgi:hypothetical protein